MESSVTVRQPGWQKLGRIRSKVAKKCAALHENPPHWRRVNAR
jgi:hypothetical protein